MDNTTVGALAGLWLIALVFLLVLGILWILVPFLIMGTNKRLSAVARQLADIQATLPRPETHIQCPDCFGFAHKKAKTCPSCGVGLRPGG